MGGHGDACEAAAQTAEGSAGRPCDDAEFAPTPASSMSKANPAGSEGSETPCGLRATGAEAQGCDAVVTPDGPGAPPPPSCTNWTRLVLLSVLTGHVSSFSPY